MILRWNDGFEEDREHLGENQGVPKWLSPNEMIQTPNSKPTQLKIKQRKEGKNQAVTNLPHLE